MCLSGPKYFVFGRRKYNELALLGIQMNALEEQIFLLIQVFYL